MLRREIKAYWAAITGVVGVVGAIGTLWLTNQDQRSRLNDSERDFVLKVIELMGEHPQLDTAVLQVVGAKHWDGLAFALVK